MERFKTIKKLKKKLNNTFIANFFEQLISLSLQLQISKEDYHFKNKKKENIKLILNKKIIQKI